jgi:hypothetical protein
MLLVMLCGSVGASTDDPAALEKTLAAIDDAARHYTAQALRFTSDETIVLSRGPRTATHRFRHIYVVDDQGKHDELRAPVNRRQNPDAVAATTAYNWIFLFESGRHEYLEYSLVGVEQRLGREAIGIAFGPRGEAVAQLNDWYGVAWFDHETHLPLVFEAWSPVEYARKLELEERLSSAAEQRRRSRSEHTITSVRTEFREERNGLRLPTRVTLRETRFVVWGKKGTSGYRQETLASVKQSYSNYRFYDVDTEEPTFDPG